MSIYIHTRVCIYIYIYVVEILGVKEIKFSIKSMWLQSF